MHTFSVCAYIFSNENIIAQHNVFCISCIGRHGFHNYHIKTLKWLRVAVINPKSCLCWPLLTILALFSCSYFWHAIDNWASQNFPPLYNLMPFSVSKDIKILFSLRTAWKILFLEVQEKMNLKGGKYSQNIFLKVWDKIENLIMKL